MNALDYTKNHKKSSAVIQPVFHIVAKNREKQKIGQVQ